MKKQLLTLLLASGVTMLMAFGDTETRNLSSFSEISVAAGIKATLVKGNVNKADIDAEGIELDKVITEVDGDRLIVKIKTRMWGNWGNKRNVKVTITYSESLESVSASSGASVVSDEVLRTASRLELQSSSGANSKLKVNTENISADVSSGASLNVEGSANTIEIDVSSGSSFKGYDLVCKNVNVDVSSGGSAYVHATSELDADVSSGGSVKYKGNPSSKNIDKSSGGSVKPAS